ncbi:RNA polymerase sigma factor [Nocardiopsis sp. LOL_012]|uniref:RNA polymerase sigma factor n=1 Tax=Nocardiopsis sp. LOL_012 TaxID=3345409 RepID=UPI003A8A63E3
MVDRHLPMVNAIARSHRLSAADREDAVQTVWLTLNQQLPRLRSPESLRSWLRRVTNDVCGRQRRQAARHSPVDPHSLSLAGPDHLPDPETHVLDREEREELHRAVGRLTDPRDRSAALDYLGLSRRGRGGPTAATAANQRRRMIRRLRRILEEGP